MAIAERVTIQEWAASDDPFQALGRSGLDAEHAISLLSRTASALGKNPDSKRRLELEGTKVRAAGIAGIVRLTPGIEVEIVPKFLDAAVDWQADFFQMAMVTKHAGLMSAAPIAATVEQNADLATIVARNLMHQIRANRRAPLRTYKVRHWVDFEIDGEVSPDDALFASDEGFTQSLPIFIRRNRYTALVDRALGVLADEVRDPRIASQLRGLRSGNGPEVRDAIGRLRAPGRHRRWQPVLDLSYLVCTGFGGSMRSDVMHAPGFYLDTWRAWEDLITFALRRTLSGAATVCSQGSLELGVRQRGGVEKPATTTPDIVIQTGTSALVVDAKYKGRRGKAPRITNEDVYEALAFLKASATNRAVLLYPKEPGIDPEPVGTVAEFERVRVDTAEVIGATVAVQGLGQSGGLAEFSRVVGGWIGKAI